MAIGEAEDAVTRLEKAGALHAANLPVPGQSFTTDGVVADEKETVALMRAGRDRGASVMRGRAVDKALRNGPLTAGQKDAVKLILSGKDRTVGVQGYAGTGKTAMLNRARALLEKHGVAGLAPSASAARTLENEAGIRSETRFLARNAGVAERRLTARGERQMRAAFRKTVLVVDEGSLASTVQARHELVNSATAEVAAVKDGTVRFRVEDGRLLNMRKDDPRLRHIDRAWASTVHAFQGRTVDTVIAAMEANHPHLTTQKTLYVETSRARDRAELVTDDRNALRERLEVATGERIAALEAMEPERVKDRRPEPVYGRGREEGTSEPGHRTPKKVRESREIEMEM